MLPDNCTQILLLEVREIFEKVSPELVGKKDIII